MKTWIVPIPHGAMIVRAMIAANARQIVYEELCMLVGRSMVFSAEVGEPVEIKDHPILIEYLNGEFQELGD